MHKSSAPVEVWVYSPGDAATIENTYLYNQRCPQVFQPLPYGAQDWKLGTAVTPFYMPRNNPVDDAAAHRPVAIDPLFNNAAIQTDATELDPDYAIYVYSQPWVTHFKLYKQGTSAADKEQRTLDGTSISMVGINDPIPVVTPDACAPRQVPTSTAEPEATQPVTVTQAPVTVPSNPGVPAPDASYPYAAAANQPNQAFVWRWLGEIPADPSGPAVTRYYVQVYTTGSTISNDPQSSDTSAPSAYSGQSPVEWYCYTGQDGSSHCPYSSKAVSMNTLINNFAIGAFPTDKYVASPARCPLCNASLTPLRGGTGWVTDYPAITSNGVSQIPTIGGAPPTQSPTPGDSGAPNSLGGTGSLDGEAPDDPGSSIAPYICTYDYSLATPTVSHCTAGELSTGDAFACQKLNAQNTPVAVRPEDFGGCPSGSLTAWPNATPADPSWPLVYGDGAVSIYVPQIAPTGTPTATVPTSTPEDTATNTPSATSTLIPSNTPTIVPTATNCGGCSPTATPTASATFTQTPSPTITATPTVTETPTPTNTPLPPNEPGAVIPIGDVPVNFAGRTLEIGLFGPGDVVNCGHLGSAWMAVVGPNGQYYPFTWYAKADPGTMRTGDPGNTDASVAAVGGHHDARDMQNLADQARTWTSGDPPKWLQFQQPLTHVDQSDNLQSAEISWEENENKVPDRLKNIQGVMVAEDGHYFFDGSWLYIDVKIPTVSNGYVGGYWKLEYVPVPRPVVNGGILSSDRITMTLAVKGSPVHLVQ